MQAEGIRTGDRYDQLNGQGKVIGGWTATGDAVIEDGKVRVPVVHHDGGDGVREWDLGTQVPLTFGAGPQPRFPKGTPEYDKYEADLKEELAKWVAGEGEYAADR